MAEKYKNDKQAPIFRREIINVFLRDIHKRRTEGGESLEKYCQEIAEKIVKGEPALTYLLNEIIRIMPKKQQAGILQGASILYELVRRQEDRDSLETDLNNRL